MVSTDSKVSDVKDDYDWKSLEVEIQWIRLTYLKWLYHFNPNPSDAQEAMM